MKKTRLLWVAAAAVLAAGVQSRADEPAGDWAGVLVGSLHTVVHLSRGADGKLSGVLEVIEQGDAKIPIGEIDATSDHLKFAVPAVQGSYDGTWDEAKKQWSGTWTQGRAMPLDLHRAAAADLLAFRRPQEESIGKGARPYRSEEVSFGNPQAAGVTLKGLFSKPEGAGPFPAVVLIAGSGPQSRNEAVGNHEVFLVLADYLNRQGIAVLRYDKRGIGASTGAYATATTADFSSDAEAAVRYLATRSDVDARHVGVLGHSEGGIIAPVVAVADPQVSFVVLMAGLGLRGDVALLKQNELIARAHGMPEAKLAEAQTQRAASYAIIEASTDAADAKAKLEAAADKAVAAGTLKPDMAGKGIATLTSPWFYYMLRYDPAPTLEKVRVPVLALNGSLDLQVEPKGNLAAIQAALKNDRDVSVQELPGLNHLFQQAKTGSPDEYGQIEETVSPVALKTIGDWIVAHTKPSM